MSVPRVSEYCLAAPRIRGMRSRLLGPDDFLMLSSSSSLEDLASRLRSTHYSRVLESRTGALAGCLDLYSRLRGVLVIDYKNLRALLPPRASAILDIYMEKHVAANLRIHAKYAYTGDERLLSLIDARVETVMGLTDLVAAYLSAAPPHAVEEALERHGLKSYADAHREALKALADGLPGFYADAVVEREYLERIMDAPGLAAPDERPGLQRLLRLDVELAATATLTRARRLGLPPELAANLAPSPLREKAMENYYSQEALAKALAPTLHAAAESSDPQALARAHSRLTRLEANRIISYDTFSPAAALAAIKLREAELAEIHRICIEVEKKRLG